MQAVCYIGQGKYEEADSAILEAMEKDDTNATSLINAISLSAHIEKPAEVSLKARESHFLQNDIRLGICLEFDQNIVFVVSSISLVLLCRW